MDRRHYLTSSAFFCASAIAGCANTSQDSGVDDNPDTQANTNETGETPDESDENGEEDGAFGGPPEDETGFNEGSPTYSLEIEERRQPEQDIAVSIEFSNYSYSPDRFQPQSAEHPVQLDVTLENEAEESRTLEFQGFVPFPNPRAPFDAPSDYMYGLLLVPSFDFEGNSLSVNEQIPDYQLVEEFWKATEAFEVPQETTTLTLGPGETIGGKHLLIGTTHHEIHPTADGPGGGGDFQSSATVMTPNEEQFEITYGFTLNINIAKA